MVPSAYSKFRIGGLHAVSNEQRESNEVRVTWLPTLSHLEIIDLASAVHLDKDVFGTGAPHHDAIARIVILEVEDHGILLEIGAEEDFYCEARWAAKAEDGCSDLHGEVVLTTLGMNRTLRDSLTLT